MQKYVNWAFPLPRTHTGMMFGNATTGLLVWGAGNQLKITIGRADFWDHRGGMLWNEKQNYKDIRKCLEKNDANGIKNIFAPVTENVPGQPKRPSVVPVGRIDIMLPGKAELLRGKLNIKTGLAEVVYSSKNTEKIIKVQLSMRRQIALIELPEKNVSMESVPSWEYKKEYLKSISFEKPLMLDGKNLKGWIQKLPVDPALCVGYKMDGGNLWLVTDRSENIDELIKSSEGKLLSAIDAGKEKFSSENRKWWKLYWNDIPEINVPNEKLDFIYCYGLYKFGCFTNPDGIPATLQGPWIEEYEMPPWSSDYHFNINVQMCYWPAYKANRFSHLKPIFDLVWSWKEQLRRNAKFFIGIDDGYMLPHAVDDRCTCMGSFWTGTIDHACSAWIAQMMFSYYKYTGDMAFLGETAYPFMKGVLRVYEAMLEKNNGKYVLPVSVSPEYGGADMDAWGKNASFQLAAIHRLCEDLLEASAVLNEKASPVWSDILKHLPKVTCVGEKNKERIALWENKDLEESHRHHSHLGAICPFDSFDIYAEEWMPVIARSVDHWIMKGSGTWSGWCVPWASMIHSRLGNSDMAEMLLETWLRVFTNEGYGSLHDCNVSGFSIMGASNFGNIFPSRGEFMQMDGCMGAVTAVQDMLMHSRRGVTYVLPGVPRGWKNVSFNDMPAEGGFLISAEKESGKINSISIKSLRGGILKIANPWGDGKVSITHSKGSETVLNGKILEIKIKQGESCCLSDL